MALRGRSRCKLSTQLIELGGKLLNGQLFRLKKPAIQGACQSRMNARSEIEHALVWHFWGLLFWRRQQRMAPRDGHRRAAAAAASRTTMALFVWPGAADTFMGLGSRRLSSALVGSRCRPSAVKGQDWPRQPTTTTTLARAKRERRAEARGPISKSRLTQLEPPFAASL